MESQVCRNFMKTPKLMSCVQHARAKIQQNTHKFHLDSGKKNQLQTLKRNQVKSIRRHTEREKLEKQMQSKSSS